MGKDELETGTAEVAGLGPLIIMRKPDKCNVNVISPF
jgi:hypothetical protein